jgi:hypothetical protein
MKNCSKFWADILMKRMPDFTEELANLFLKEYKQDYIIRAREIIGSEDNNKDLFSWLSKSMNIWILITSSNSNFDATLFIAEYSHNGKDNLYIMDLRKETKDFQFKRLSSPSDKVSYILNNNLIENIDTQSIIHSSIWANDIAFATRFWVDKEYNASTAKLSLPPIKHVDFNKLRIHADRYQFDTMIKDINDDQFSAEFSECLTAYENEQFYVCAAGLGGVLEHLMYLTLDKHDMLDKNFSDNATYQDYVTYFGREPLNIDKRQKTAIKNTFMIRNSVSHFNSGFTGKENCQLLMSGIKNVYANYYIRVFNLPSID